MPKELTWQEAIERVLAESPIPLHYSEIADRIIGGGHRTSLGATPAATVAAVITSSIKHDGPKSPYIRVSKGTYALARSGFQPTATTAITPTALSVVEETEEQYAVVSSFG